MCMLNHIVSHVMCETFGNILFNFLLISIISDYLKPSETPLFDENKLLYECKILWNKIVKGIENFVFKGFDIVMNV